MDLERDRLLDLLYLIASLLIAFGLGLRWDIYMENNPFAIVVYLGFLIAAAVHFYKQL